MALTLGMCASGRHPAVFLDKDGTVVENVPYNVDPALVSFTPGAIEGLQLLADAGFRLVMITNQPGVGLGLFDEAALVRLQRWLTDRLAERGIPLEGFYACTHAPGLDASRPPCACRKPAPGAVAAGGRGPRSRPRPLVDGGRHPGRHRGRAPCGVPHGDAGCRQRDRVAHVAVACAAPSRRRLLGSRLPHRQALRGGCTRP